MLNLGAKLLDESGLKLISANGLSDAAEKIVATSKKRKSINMSAVIKQKHQSIEFQRFYSKNNFPQHKR